MAFCTISVRARRDTFKNSLQLNPGDRIGVVAPAGPFDPEALKRGVAWLQEAGFEVCTPPELYARNGYLAGSDRHRATALERLFADDNIQGIICARGGYGCLRLLEHLDLAMIRRHPKPFIGFSDITVLLWVFYRHAGLRPFHGPMGTTLALGTAADREHFRRALAGEAPLLISSPDAICLEPGVVTAPLIGGNLTSLCHLLGTPWQPCFKDHILLLEDCNEAPYRLDRMLKQMQLAGCFRQLAGVLLGSFEGCGPPETSRAVCKEYFKGIPCLAEFPAGHGQRNLVLPLGVAATLNPQGKTLMFENSVVDSVKVTRGPQAD